MKLPRLPSTSFPLRVELQRRPTSAEVRVVARTGQAWAAGEFVASSDVESLGDAATSVRMVSDQVAALNRRHAALLKLADGMLPGGFLRGMSRLLARVGGPVLALAGAAVAAFAMATPVGLPLSVAAAAVAMGSLVLAKQPVSDKRAEYNLWSAGFAVLALGTAFTEGPVGPGLGALWLGYGGLLAVRWRWPGARAVPHLVERLARALGRPFAADLTVTREPGAGNAAAWWRISFRDARGGTRELRLDDVDVPDEHLLAEAARLLEPEQDLLLGPSPAAVLHGTLERAIDAPPTGAQQWMARIRRLGRGPGTG